MAAIILIAGIAGTVWGLYLAMRGSLLVGCLIYLLLACCCGPYLFSFDAVGMTWSLDRLFLIGLVVAYIVQWQTGRTEPKPIVLTDLALFAMVGVFAISALTHDWRSGGPDEVPVLQHLINGYLIPLVIYWIARQSRLDQKSTTAVLVAMLIFGVYLAATAVLEASGQWSLVFPRYIADPAVGLHFGRARGPMLHSVSFGFYLAACLLGVSLLMRRIPRGWLPILLTAVPLLLAAIYLTKTRSVWVGAATGVVVVLALTLKGRFRWGVLGSMVAAGMLVFLINADAIMGVRREGTVQDTHRSNNMRASFAYVSWLMFQDKPVFGFGFGQFAKEKLPYLSDRTTDLHLEAIRDWVHHNTFLSILTETGLIGFLLFLAVLTGWARAGWQLHRNERAPAWMQGHGVLLLGTLGIAFWQMLGHEITFTPLDMSLIFCVAGIGVGLKTALAAKSAIPQPAAQTAFPKFEQWRAVR